MELNVFESCQAEKLAVVVYFCLEIHKVPVVCEVSGDIVDAAASDLDGDVVPGHLRFVQGKVTDCEVSGLVNVTDSEVAHVSSFPPVGITKLMLRSIPPPVADIESSQKSNSLVDQHNLFVVAPEKGDDEVVGVSHDLDVLVLVAQRLQVLFNELRVVVNCYLRFLVYDDVNFNIFVGKFLQNTVKPVLPSVQGVRPFEDEVRSYHPSGDIDVFLSFFELTVEIFEVKLPVDIKL
jgi:hypothetical protein